jgi:hypothetical protein
MNNACPECAAIYAVAEKDIGRRIACKRCSTPLVVGEEGLKREEDVEPPKLTPEEEPASKSKDRDDDRERKRDRDDDSRDRPRSRSRGRNDDDDRPARRPESSAPALGPLLAKLKGVGDVPTWLYGIGLFFVVYSFFSGRIDDAKVSSRQGYLEEKQTESTIADREDKNKNNGDLSEGRRKAQKETKEKVIDPATDSVAFARSGKLQAEWWNITFQMFGFIIISFGSLGFLSPKQPPLQRIVGGITLLLVLFQVVGGGAVLHVGFGGGIPK